MNSIFGLCLILICAVHSPAAGAGYPGPMRFSVFWPCSGNSGICAPRILAEGVVERDSGAKFSRFLENPQAHSHKLPPAATVVFDSPGGNLVGGMELGRVIRANKLQTALASGYAQIYKGDMGERVFLNSAICASACSLAFVGGVRRKLEDDARFGIHQFSGNRGSVGDGATQVTIVILAAYLEEMGIDRQLLDVASLISASQMHWLTPQQARQLRVDNTRSKSIPWAIRASAQGVPFLVIEQEISYGRRIRLAISMEKNRAIVFAITNLERAAFADDRIKQFPVNEPPLLAFEVDGRSLDAHPLENWTKTESGSAVSFRSVSTISLSALQGLSSASLLKISDGFGNAMADVSLTTELSTEGLTSGIALLLRTR